MAGEDRTFSIGAFDREFEKIQSDLQGISEGIDKRLSSPIASKTRSSITGIEENKAISNYDFNELLTCSDEEFDDKTNSMKSVDIDMVIIIFEQQIQMIRELNTELGTANLSQLRERLTKCFMKKTELVRRQSKPLIVEHSFVKDSSVSNDNGSEDFTALEDISSLSFAELQALLYYNGVEYDENSNKEALVTLVRSEILDIDDGAIDDWEPPGDNEILWKSPGEL